MKYKDVSDAYPGHISVWGSDEWFLVKATFREIRQTGSILNHAKDYRGLQDRHPGLKMLASKLLETVADLQDRPESFEHKEKILVVDGADLDLFFMATKWSEWRMLKLEPEEQPSLPAAPCCSRIELVEPTQIVSITNDYL